MNERANVTNDPLLFVRLVTRRQAEQALRREAALREVTRQGGQVMIYLPGKTAPEAPKVKHRAKRGKRRRILQRLTVAALIAVLLLEAFSIGVEIGKGNGNAGGGEVSPTAANEREAGR